MIETAGNKSKTDEGPVSKNRRDRISAYKKRLTGRFFDPLFTILMLLLITPLPLALIGQAARGMIRLIPFFGFLVLISILSGPLTFGAGFVTKRWKRYEKTFEDRAPENDMMQINRISDCTGIPEKQIRSDISWLREYGVIPNDWYKKETDTLYLPDAPAPKETGAAQENAEPIQEKTAREEMPDVPQMNLSQYAEKISELSEKVTDREMSERVSALRVITEKITDYADSHPENAVMPQKLAGYYFPTIVRLLEVYIDLDERNITGRNAEKIREEIRDAISSANIALDNALEKMLANAEIDTSADIGAMKAKAELDGLLQTQQAAAYQENTEEG